MKLEQANPLYDEVRRFTYGDGEVQVGSIAIHFNDITKEWALWSVEIYPAFQGLGHGTEMVKLAMDTVRATGGKRVHLYVRADNAPAIAMYEKLGFAAVTHWGYPRNILRMEASL